jgi:hypothetical protein
LQIQEFLKSMKAWKPSFLSLKASFFGQLRL